MSHSRVGSGSACWSIARKCAATQPVWLQRSLTFEGPRSARKYSRVIETRFSAALDSGVRVSPVVSARATSASRPWSELGSSPAGTPGWVGSIHSSGEPETWTIA